MHASHVPQNIALWGPRGSGKTWLINAFCKALAQIGAEEPRFSYELLQYAGKQFSSPVLIFEPSALPTNEHTVFVWQFCRRSLQHSSLADQVSVHLHDLLVHDMPGRETIMLTEEAREVFLRADLILVVLDPTLVNGAPLSRGNDASVSISKTEYAGYARRLFECVTNAPKPHPEIAVCLTKLDCLIGTARQDELIREHFGSEMLQVLSAFRGRLRMKMFGISSAGYIDGSAAAANYDPGNGRLLDASLWEPRFVERPFFWFLENVERERLRQHSHSLGKFFCTVNLSKYVGYPNHD
jgi:hypothetical protein